MDIITYRAIASIIQAEFEDRGSRFVASVYPIQTLEEVKQYALILREKHYKARYWRCTYCLGVDGTRLRANGDGEPAGSEGRPILGQADSAGLMDVLMAVARYFGGTSLGVPGLIRAHKTTTVRALTVMEVIERNIEKMVRLCCKYFYLNEATRITRQSQGNIIE